MTNTDLILAFDVETTGLLPKNPLDLNDCPYILQMSFAIYNIKNRKIEESYNFYIKIQQ
jgi:hypothetical protein